MSQNIRNIVWFVVLAATLSGLWWYAEQNWLPKPQKRELTEAEKNETQKKVEEDAQKRAAEAKKAAEPPPPPPAPVAVVPAAPAERARLIALGDSSYYNQVLLSTRGGGVQQVVLTAFHQANRLGEEVKQEGAPIPLYLIPGTVVQRGPFLKEPFVVPDLKAGTEIDPTTAAPPSYTLFLYNTADDKFPDAAVGELNWTQIKIEELEEADRPTADASVALRLAVPAQGLTITKIYTLNRSDYHIGLRVVFRRTGETTNPKLRCQISGPRGLPVEGEWYSSTSRIALIGYENNRGAARREYEDAASIGIKRGGESYGRTDNQWKYAAISTQYFASALAVDDRAEAVGAAKNPWTYVRATTELPFDKLADPHTPQFDDITFRAVSDLDLPTGQRVAHSYLIYNGPSKVRLLKLLQDDQRVDPALVDRYHDALGLRTLTDYQSPNFMGRIASAIYWTELVVVFTNLMHWLLYAIHTVVSDWALSILVLTIMVRLLLFVPSRKQTQMNLRMMEIQKQLQPELEKLHEKYKDDFHTYNREKTRLMMQHGFNPLAMMGGCLLLFAQMPIMMGLYFCLQESVFFRLEPFLWVQNLAAPDMTLWWGEQVPYISAPSDIGAFYYLGPYLNVLPIIAVGLMMYQQHKMMPPPTDEQMAAQQRMMKIMMIVIAVMFYKVAAGLALYFIISTSWGIIERRFIPKPSIKPTDGDGPSETALGSANAPGKSASNPVKPKGALGRLRERLQKKMEELQKQAEEQSSRQVRNNPNRQDPNRNSERRDKKKKRK